MKNITIVGCGIAGFTAAKFLRIKAPDAEIVLLDSGTHGLYSRIRLPEVLAGTLPEEKLVLSSPEAIRALGIDFRPSCEVSAIHPEQKRLAFSGSQTLAYDTLILATGADAALPPIQGAEQNMTLRSLEDVQRILRQMPDRKFATVIGGGLLGLEAAHALLQRGQKVTIIEMQPRLLPRQLSEAESAILSRKFDELGYRVFTGRSTELLARTADGWRIRLDDGTEFETELILISAGIRPRAELAKAAGAQIDRGIIVDDRFATSLPDVYAIGDCAQFDGKVNGLWAAAKDQGTALAAILAGEQEKFISPVYEPSLKIPGIKLKEIRMAVQT